MAGDAATKTASSVRPSDEQLSQIDEPAADNTWHEVPDVKAIRAQASEKYNQNKLFGKEKAQKIADESARTAEQNDDPHAGAAVGIDSLKQTANENISDEDRRRAEEKKRELRERSQNYLRSKMPKERREQTIWRLKKMVVEVQGHQDCKLLCTELISLYILTVFQTCALLRLCFVSPRSTLVTPNILPDKAPVLSKVPILMTVCSWLRLTSRCVHRTYEKRKYQNRANRSKDAY